MSALSSLLAAPETVTHADLDLIQGYWTTAAGPRDARLHVTGHRFVFEFRDGDTYTGRIDLDPHADPKRMDMHIEEGPPAHKGKRALCIYDLDEGAILRWCPAKPGAEARLICFPDVDDARFLSLIFKRVHARRGS